MAAVRNGNWREAGGRGFRSAPYLLNIKRKGCVSRTVFCLWNTLFQRKAFDLGKESGGFVEEPKRGTLMPKHDLLIFYGALAVAGCLMVVGIVSYPNSRQLTSETSADVQSAHHIDRNQ